MDISRKADDRIEATEYDEALKHTGFGKFNVYIIFVCGMCMGSSFLCSVDVSYLLPVTGCEFQLSPFQKGLLSSSYFAGMIINSQFGGFLSDVLGRQYTLIRGMILNSIIYGFAVFTPNFTTLVLIKFCSGLAACVGMTVTLSYIGECNTPRNRSRSIMLFTTMGGSSVIYLTVASWLILPGHWSFPLGWITFKPWRLLTLMCGLPSIVAALLVHTIPESPKFQLACGRKDDSLRTLQHMYSINTGKPPTDYPVKRLLQDPNDIITVGSLKNVCGMFKQMLTETLTLLKPPFKRNFLLSCWVMFCTLYCLSMAVLWLPEVTNAIGLYGDKYGHTYSLFCEMVPKKQDHLTTNYSIAVEGNPHFYSEMTEEAYVNSSIQSTNKTECVGTIKDEVFLPNVIIAVSQPVAFLVVSCFIHKLNKKWTIVLFLFTCSALYLALNFISHGSFIIIIFGVTPVLSGINYNLLANLVVDIFPTNISCLAVSLTMMCGRLGSMIGSNLFGILIGHYCTLLLYLPCGLTFVSSILATFFDTGKQHEQRSHGTKTTNV